MCWVIVIVFLKLITFVIVAFGASVWLCSVRIIIDGKVYCVYLLHRQRVNVFNTNIYNHFWLPTPSHIQPQFELFVLSLVDFCFGCCCCWKINWIHWMKSTKNEKSMSLLLFVLYLCQCNITITWHYDVCICGNVWLQIVASFFFCLICISFSCEI